MEPLRKNSVFIFMFITFVQMSNGCTINSIDNWLLPVSVSILDTDRGVIFSALTSDIEETSATPGEGLNGGPYVTVTLENNYLIISTNNNFPNYEEVETAQSMNYRVDFRCSEGSSRFLIFVISITDTNNNNPQYIPSSNYEFTIAPPLPPNFLITDCVNDIVVRDIDLTTQRIDFEIEGSSLFEIAYDESSTVPKEFKAILRTTTFIRSISEPITLTIRATDVDQTGDPRRTSTGTVTISANTEFELPSEPIFSQPFYLASYNSEQGFVLQDIIYLRQGYDNQVNFTFEGEHSQYFEIDINENEVSFTVNDLPVDLYQKRQLYLIVKAEREYTSGDTATVIVQLPEELVESFDKALYRGRIENGVVSHETIALSNYENSNVLLGGEYASSFESTLSNGLVSVVVRSPEAIPENLGHVELSMQAGQATSILLLEVVTPAIESFDNVIYHGRLENGVVSHDTITLSEFIGTNIELTGDYASLFESSIANGVVTVVTRTASTIPESLTHITLTLQAGRATSVLLLEVVKPAIESFDKIIYNGRLQNGIVSHDIITLLEFTGSNIELSGEYSSLFESSLANNVVTVVKQSSAVIPDIITHITLTMQAGRATSVLLLEVVVPAIESFDNLIYNGELKNGVVSHDTITVSEFTGSNIELSGEYSSLFESSLANSVVTVVKQSSAVIPDSITHITLTMQAGRATSVLLLEVVVPAIESFDNLIYNGELKNGVVSHDTITVSEFTGSNIELSGEYASLFESSLTNGVVTVVPRASATIPESLIHITLTLQAGRANSVMLLEVVNPPTASFNSILYNGKIENGIVSHDTITLSEFTGANVELIGEYASLFESSLTNGVVTVVPRASVTIPESLTHITLTLQAGRANSVLLLGIVNPPTASFDYILYNGKIENGVVTHDTITLSDFTGSNIELLGEYASSFESSLVNREVLVVTRSAAIFPEGLTHIVLTLQAGSTNSVLLLEVISGSEIEVSASFDKILYTGKLEDGIIYHEEITIRQFDGSNIVISGDYATFFESSVTNGVVSVTIRDSASFPQELTHISLILQAGQANSVLLLQITSAGSELIETFDKVLYNGVIENNIISHEIITLSEYSGSNIQLNGEYASLFESSFSNGVVSITLRSSAVIPIELTYIPLTLQAGRANSVLLLEVLSDSQPGVIESFDKILYEGKLTDGLVSHETILLSEYSGSNVELSGDYASSFESSVTNGVVSVIANPSAVFPNELTLIALALQAQRARAVLLLDVSNTELVTFSSSSYYLWAGVNQTGTVGTVHATANSGEIIEYSLQVNDDHLQGRISINNEGEISLSGEAQMGVYNFIVMATAQNSRAQATATVLLRVDNLPQCSIDEGLSPLIVLERVEEEPHRNLIILNRTAFPDCHYSLSNVWPKNQSWLYVDNEGLHAQAIDREHESIAFMTLSQIQVVLTLICDSDEAPATRRSLSTDRLQVGPDNYGSNRWILADTIVYNSRRSFVNLIITDINDNAPIFVGKETEPIYFGYPIPELEDMVLPRALAELKATDADIGENAAIVYWSNEGVLAVSPYTGLVHVRNNAQLENNSRLTIYATDQNGSGLNGTLDIVVRLLDKDQIAIVTVRDAFLDDESDILNNLSESIGYDIKVLRTVVISDNNEVLSRRKRQIATTSAGASLQLYVYGLFENEPVDVSRLTSDISNSNIVTVNVARVVSLEDHLEVIEICSVPGRDIGLLVATIVLAVLLFLLIIAIAVWFFLKWRKTRNYEKFSDKASLASRNDSAEFPKVESISPAKPRLNIDELKRSERRLQERLEIPIQEVRMEPETYDNNKNEAPSRETVVNFTLPELPIVIQSIDKLKDNTDESEDEDEFGETNQKPRKSVVTFNENVEKIIHLEDGIEDSPEAELEVYKF